MLSSTLRYFREVMAKAHKLKLIFEVILSLPLRLRTSEVRQLFMKGDIFINKALMTRRMITFVPYYFRRITHKDTSKSPRIRLS